MPRRIHWATIEDEFVRGTMVYRDLAKSHNVGVSTLEFKAAAGDWQSKRRAYQAALESESLPVASIEVMPSLEVSGQIDVRAILDAAIARYTITLSSLEPRSLERSTDALCRLIELRSRLCPPTPEQWAELAIQYGISLTELVGELRKVIA